MTDFPRSLPEFERRFPDEAACAEWLLEHRWGSGFACPECGHDGCWRLGRKVLTLQCKACRRETSVTAGTVMHRSHLPLKVWFTAAWLVATHRNGMSARQLWLQRGLGSYKSAWLLLRKLRVRADPIELPPPPFLELTLRARSAAKAESTLRRDADYVFASYAERRALYTDFTTGFLLPRTTIYSGDDLMIRVNSLGCRGEYSNSKTPS